MNRKLRREVRRRNPHSTPPATHNARVRHHKHTHRRFQNAATAANRVAAFFAAYREAMHSFTTTQHDPDPLPRSRQGYEGGPLISDDVPQRPSKRQMVDDLVNSYLPAEDR